MQCNGMGYAWVTEDGVTNGEVLNPILNVFWPDIKYLNSVTSRGILYFLGLTLTVQCF